MRDLTRTLSLMLILAVVFAGLLGARCAGSGGSEESAGANLDSSALVETVPVARTPAQPLTTIPGPEQASAMTRGPAPFDGTDHRRAGRLAFESGDYAVCRDHLRASLGEDEARTSDRYLLGLALLRTGEPGKAVDQLARVVEESPDQVKPRTNYTRALLGVGDAEAALAFARETVDRFPEFADGWNVLGRAHLELDRHEEAQDAFLAVVDLDPAHVWGWNNLGYSRIQLGRFDEAVPPLREAVGLKPDLALAQNNLGVALERTGDLAGARDAYRAAVDAGDIGRAAASLARVEPLVPAPDVEATAVAESETVDENEAGESADVETSSPGQS